MKKLFLLSALILVIIVQVNSQERRNQRSRSNTIPLIGVEAPAFTAMSTNGTINFPADFGTNWKILFSHPKNFTPVCSSEMLELAHEQESFEKLGAKVVVLSTDNIEQHNAWKAALEEINYRERGVKKINFPLIDDNSYKVSNLYGMIHSEVNVSQNIRGVFIIDPDNKVRAIFYYPNEVGRNIDELKRTLIALQNTHNNNQYVTPANWQSGDDYMVPVMSAEDRANIGKPGSDLYQFSWFMVFRKNSN